MPAPDLSKGVAFVRGQYVPIGEASIPITDWGFLRSDATYDVVTVWEGSFFRLDAHLERFMRSRKRWRLDPGLTPEQITGVLSQCVRLSGLRATRAWPSISSMHLLCPMSGSPMPSSVKRHCT